MSNLGSSTGTRPEIVRTPQASGPRGKNKSGNAKSLNQSSPPTETSFTTSRSSQPPASTKWQTRSPKKQMRNNKVLRRKIFPAMSDASYPKAMSLSPASNSIKYIAEMGERSHSRSPESLLGSAIHELEPVRRNKPSFKLLQHQDSRDLTREAGMIAHSAMKVRSEAESGEVSTRLRRSEKRTGKLCGTRKKVAETSPTPELESSSRLVNRNLPHSRTLDTMGEQGPLVNGEIFGLVFFKGQAAGPSRTRAVKDVKQERKEAKEKKLRRTGISTRRVRSTGAKSEKRKPIKRIPSKRRMQVISELRSLRGTVLKSAQKVTKKSAMDSSAQSPCARRLFARPN